MRHFILLSLFSTFLAMPAFAGVDEFSDEETPNILSPVNDEESGCGLPLELIHEIADIEFELMGNLPEFEEVSVASPYSHSPPRTGSTSPSEATSPAIEKKRASFTWTKADDEALIEAVHYYKEERWKKIAERVGTKFSDTQCLQRWKNVLNPSHVAGLWTEEEDASLLAAVEATGLQISEITKFAGLLYAVPGRTAKQIRAHLKNYLDPSIERGPFTEYEDQEVLRLQGEYGNKWAKIAKVLNSIDRFDDAGNALKNRTEDNVKHRLNSLERQEAKEARKAAKALKHERSTSKRTRLVPKSETEQH